MDESKEIAPGIVARDGKPFVAGSDVEVEAILRELAAGASCEKIRKHFGIEEAGQLAALSYALGIMEDEIELVRGRVLAGGQSVEPAPGIIAQANIRLGKPVVAGTRVDVRLILQHLAAGDGATELAELYGLKEQDVLATIGYAAKVVSIETVTVH